MKTLKEMIAATSGKHNSEDNSNFEEFSQLYRTFRPKTWGDVLKADRQAQQESANENSFSDYLGTGVKNALDTFVMQAGLQAQGLGLQIGDLANADYYKNNPDAPVAKVAKGLGGALGNFGQSALDMYNEDASHHTSEEWANTALSDILRDPELRGRYFSDPQGFAAEFGSGLGSAGEFAALTAILSKLGLGKVADKVSGKALSGASSLLSKANLPELATMVGSDLAKEFASTALQFGSTMGPAGALTNAATTIDAQKQRGKSDGEIAAANRSMMAEEMPYDVAFAGLTGNVAKGLVGKAIAPKNSTAWQKALANAAGVPIEGAGGYYSNVEQMILADKYSGNPYGTLGNPTPNESAAGRMGIIAGLPFSAYGGVRGYLNAKAKENAQAQNQEVSKAFSDLYQNFRKDFNDNAAAAESQARQSFRDATREQAQTAERQSLRSWANDISGGKMSNEVYNSIVRNAQELGVDVKHALAQAVAESNGNQDVTSGAGAIGVMQLLPETARELGVNPDDTEENIRGGVRYLKQMYDRFGDWDSAHAAYNAGAGAVEKHGGTPPYSETRNYVAKINGFLNDSPDYQSNRNEEIYSGEDGKGEGKYWQRQNGNVSFEGAQPQLLNAIDALGKFYFENTGKKLVVTAGTNGDSHVQGEHSHYTGWKVDVVDAGGSDVSMTEDGPLTNADYSKGWFANEFIKYGQKLGLGMNWEGEGTKNVHIDVALDGTQWDGSTETTNFGGFNPQNNSVQSKADADFKKNYKPQETFADRLNREQPVQNQPSITPADNSQITTSPEPAQVTEQADNAPTDFFNGTFDTKSQVVGTADKFLEQLREEGDPQKASLLFQLQRARNNGDVAGIENILKQNNVAVSSPTQETVETNPPPPKQLSGLEKLIKVASAPVAGGKDNTNKRARQGKALLRLAQQNNIEVPSVDTKALEVGSTVKVQEWRDKFLQAGLFNEPQESAEVKKARRDWGIFKTVSQERGQKIQEARKIADNLFNLSEADENNAAGVAAPVYDSEVMEQLDRKESKQAAQRLWQAKENERLQRFAQQEEYRRWQAKQAKELKELQARQAEAKRLAEVRRQLDEQNNIDEQRAVQIADTRTAQAEEQVQQAEEQNRQKIKAQSQQAGEYALQGLAQTQSENLQAQRHSPQSNEQPEIQPPKTEIASNVESTEQQKPAQSEKKEVRGNLTQARSATRKKYQVQYKVVDVKDLITSHKSAGLGVVPNENFPQELQPRDRESVGMQHQPQTIGEHLAPDELLDSPYINLGAPVVRNDGVVLNGNGRAMGIRYAYDNVKENGEMYKQSLIRNAERFGLNGEEISKMESPVLVREVPLDLSGEEISDVIGDTTGGARMNAVETANTDTGKITASTFGAMPEDGIVDSETMSGQNFLANILGKVLKPNEINAYSDKQGTINSDGVERAKRALYAIAYDDETLLRKMSESLNDDLPKISNALKTAAPLIAKVKKFGEENLLHQYDLSAIQQAVNAFRETVKNKQTVEQYLNQETFEGMGLSPESREILLDIGKNKKSAQTMADFFMGIAKGIEEQGEPRGEDMFGNKIEPRPLIDLIREAQEKAEELAEERNNKRKRKAEISLFSRHANSDVTIKNFVADEDLTPQQKLLNTFGQKLGAETVFFDNPNGNFHGAHSNGITYLNVNSKMPLGKVFWHESMHWLKANNSKLYQQLAEAAGITDAQRKAYLEETKRNDLETDAEIDEEIIADAFEDTAKRTGLLQNVAGKNRGLIQRVVQWLKDTMNKFIDTFRNPQGKLTTAQSQALADEFGRIANKLVDSNGEKIFRYNNRTKNIELADGRNLNSIANHNVFNSKRNYSFAGEINVADEKYMRAFEDYQNAKTEEESRIAMEKLQSMVQQAAEAAGFHNAVPEQTVAYKVRTTAAPKKTVKVYKVFTVANDGSPTALFVGGTEKLPQGVWLDAQDAYHFKAKNGLYYVPSTQNPFTKGGKTGAAVEIPSESTRQELIERGFLPKGSKATKVTALAYRPGWHAGTLPFFPQGGMKPPKGMKSAYENIHRYNQVVFECELAADKNYTAEAEAQPKARNKDGSLNSRKADLQRMPESGFYYYATNPMTHGHPELGMWAISGSLKINRALTQEECDKILAKHGRAPQEWEQGKLNLADLGYTGEQNDSARKTLAPITYDDNGNVIPLSQRFDSTKDDIRYSIGASDNSDESTLQRIRNKAAAWFSGRKALSERRNKRIVQRIEGLTNYKIAFNGVDETIVDDFHRLIRTPHAYQWEKFLPAVSEKIAHVLKLPAQKEMANYISDWILTGALNNTSAEKEKFQKAMLDDPPTAEALIALRNEFKEITEMTPEERYGEKIVHPQKTLTAKIMEKFTKEEWIDDLAPLQKMIDRITEDQPELGAELKKGINPLEMARLYRGKGGMISDLMIHGTAKNLDKIKAALQEQYPNVNFKWFKPLDMIIAEAGGQKNLKALEIFAVAKLDKEIFEWNRAHPNEKVTPTNPNEADADAVIKNGEAQFGQAQRDLVSFSRTLLDIQHDAGLITDKQYFSTIRRWKNYIPMARVFDENENFGFMSSLKGEKTGSERDTYTPIGRLIINANEYIRQAERNKIKQELAGLARMGAFAKYIEERDTNKVDAKNHIVFYENGKRKYLQTAPEVVRAVEALGGRTESVMIVKLLHAATKAVTASYTTLNLDFAAGNPFRDLADSYLHNKHIGKNPLPFLMDGFIQIFRGLTGKRANDADFIEWVANGGSQASLVSPDIDYVQRDIDSLGTTFKERFRKNPFSTVLEGLQRVAEHGEQAVRLANYRAARDALAKQRADGKATVEDKRKAALISREASIDFAKAGRSTRVLNRVFAFTNAAVQSWNLDYRRYVEPLFTEEGRKKVWVNYFKLGMMYMVPTVLQAALCYDKDWWKEKKDWEKETYWFFGDMIKIPKGLDVAGRLTAAFTDAALSHWLLKEPVEFERFATTVKNAMPSLTTTIFTPLVETALNRSWFRQAPIVPAAEQHLPAPLQYGSETSPVAKLFGEQTGVSPRKIDYMINGYFGFLGKFFSGKYFTGDFNELPFVHRFKNVPYKNSKSVQRFYEVYDEQDKLYNGYKLELKRDQKTKPPKELDMALYRRLKRAMESMQRISKQRKLIEADKKLNADKREEKLLALEKQRIELCQRVLNGAR